MDVKSAFDTAAAAYDTSRRQLVPCFDDFYRALVDMIPLGRDGQIEALDLGAGTGLVAEMVLREFPSARVTLLDFSGEMLETARKRLERFSERTAFRICDYAREELPGQFDLVCSALSIHHLGASGKEHLYGRAFQSLRPAGVFVNADHVEGASPRLFETYRRLWIERTKELGVPEDVLEQALERTKLDRLSPLDDQLRWLREAGFEDVDCYYKWYHFAVFGGRRPAEKEQ